MDNMFSAFFPRKRIFTLPFSCFIGEQHWRNAILVSLLPELVQRAVLTDFAFLVCCAQQTSKEYILMQEKCHVFTGFY